MHENFSFGKYKKKDEIWQNLWVTNRLVARIWKRGGGGLFWKSEKSANNLDPNFHCSWIRITQFVRKLKGNFSESSEIQRFFPPKNRWSPKKKGLHRNWDWFFGQNRKFKRFFRPNHDMYFTTSAPNFLWGGLFSIFHQKSASKAPKTCDFAYFTSQWGGARVPRPPGYANGNKMRESPKLRLPKFRTFKPLKIDVSNFRIGRY